MVLRNPCGGFEVYSRISNKTVYGGGFLLFLVGFDIRFEECLYGKPYDVRPVLAVKASERFPLFGSFRGPVAPREPVREACQDRLEARRSRAPGERSAVHFQY